MSILLTEEEECTVLGFGEFTSESTKVTLQAISRAIQLALIEKLRKEPVGEFWYEGDDDRHQHEWGIAVKTGARIDSGDMLYRLPTPQELEEEKC